MITVANPIYDIVFKYLMEDERIARTILSALLKVDVLAVEVRPHEYSDQSRDGLSVFRIDFGATIRDADGKEKLILIELQKTFLETETLRFRQYLGVHYNNPKNMLNGDYAIPMVSVYLLGHKVGDIEEPVLYVSHQACDYNGNVVTKGLPDPFVESLTHDSIIVQIPRLHGHVNNRLDMVLSIFDQSRRTESDNRMLNINADAYSGDTEMERILHRLSMAAANAEMRMQMNVEDEYFSIIEKRDTEIMMRDRHIAEQKAQLSAQEEKLSAQEEKLSAQEENLSAQEEKLSAQEEKLSAQEEKLSAQEAQLEEKDNMLRLTVELLVKSGKSLESVAESLGVSMERIKQILG